MKTLYIKYIIKNIIYKTITNFQENKIIKKVSFFFQHYKGNRKRHSASYTGTESIVLIMGLGLPIVDLIDHIRTCINSTIAKSTLACLQVISRLRDAEKNGRGEKRDTLLQIMARNFKMKDDADVFTKLLSRDMNISHSMLSFVLLDYKS